MEKNEIRLLPNTIHKDKLKMDGKHRQNTLCHKSQQDPLSPTSYSSQKKKKIKWDIIKLKGLSKAKEIINKVKRQCSEWEKITANETTDKGLISKRCKQLIQINTPHPPKKQTTQLKSGEKT